MRMFVGCRVPAGLEAPPHHHALLAGHDPAADLVADPLDGNRRQLVVTGNDGHVVILLQRSRPNMGQRKSTVLRSRGSQPRRFAAATTSSTVKPKYLNSASAGADAPKRSMPTTAPSRPTYLRQ